jgi:translocation and assembly module TamB
VGRAGEGATPPGGNGRTPTRGKRRWLRLLGVGLAAALALLLAAAGALAWLGSAAGVQWLASRTPLQIGTAQLVARDVRGSLWSALRIGQLQIVTPTDMLTLTDAELRWQPAALWRRQLAIARLSAQRVDLQQTHPAPPSAPPRLPTSLRLPLDVSIDRIAIGALRVGPPGKLRDVGGLNGTLRYARGQWSAQLDAVTPWARAQLHATVSDAAPFALHATLAATHLGLAGRATARDAALLRASGTLRDLALDGTLRIAAASAQLHARLTPFDRTPLARAKLTSTALDPAAFDPALPRAALDVQLDLGPSSAQRLQGQITLRNRIPGAIDQQRLPLRSVQARLTGDAQHASADDLRIDLGAGGQLRGSLTWNAPTLQARLQASSLNARAIDTQLATTQLSGPISLDASAQQQRAQIALTQPGWDLRLTAARAGDSVHVDQLTLAARGGRLDASGNLSTAGAQRFDLRARLRRFNPAHFGNYPAATLDADLTASGSVQQRSARLALQVDRSIWRGRTFTGHARLALSAQRLWDVDAALRLGDNQLSAQGAFGLPRDTLRWTLSAPALAQLDPALSGRLQAQGTLRGGLQAPSGQIALQADELRWAQRLALHHLVADGHFDTGAAPAHPGAPLIAALLDRLAGAISLNLDGVQSTLGAQTLRLGALQAQARASAGLSGQLQLSARLQDLQADGQKLADATLQIDGTRAQHTIALAARGQLQRSGAAPAVPLDLRLRAEGGWLGAQQRWRGSITALDNRGSAALQLQTPAALDLAFSPLRLRLQRAMFTLQSGRIDLAELDIAPGQLRTQGKLQAVNTADVLQLAGIALPRVRNTLVVSGDWALDAGAQVDGRVHLQRDSGDIALQLAAPPPQVGSVTVAPQCTATLGGSRSRGGFLPLDIGQMALDLTVKDSRVRAQAVLQTAIGTAQASGELALSQRDGLWGVAGDTPLVLDAGADMPSLAWAAPLIGFDYRAAGRLQLALQGRGTVADPQFSGTLTGRALRLAWAAQGVDLRDGVLRAHFSGDRLQLDQLEFHGGDGLLTATGSARLQNGLPRATLELRATKLTALNRPDRQLVLSGHARAELADKVLAITTDLTADRADIALPRSSGPTLSNDVVIQGRAAPPAQSAAAMPRAVRFDGTFHLGTDFHLYGQGLDAMLSGSVRVRADDGAPPTATGSIELVKGEYTAYGQQLQVTQGRINFSGPLDNPGINITATRPNLPTGISVGVTVTGSALQPKIQLSATPAMPDTEILSWLVLGQPLDQVGAADIGLLQTAAAALLGPSDGLPLQTRLAHALGLDSISVQSAAASNGNAGGNGLQGTIVTLSKRLSSNTLVSFSRGLDGVSSIFTIQYQLTKRLSVQTQTGSENAVDLFYTFTFR